MAGVLVIGSSNTDYVCRAPRIPAPGETIEGSAFQTHSGGKGANQAVAAARAGADVTFVGAQGNDRIGVDRRADLIDAGIDVSRFRVIEGERSGIAVIVVADNGENQIVYIPGANARVGVDDARPALDADGWTVLSLTFEAPFEIVAHALKNRRPGTLAVLNTAPADSRAERLLSHVDVLVCNAGEAEALLGKSVTPSSATTAVRELSKRVRLGAVITLGAGGAVAADQSLAWWTVPPKMSVVDTTGAGDALCGALCAWLSDGRSLRDSVQAGVAAGALAVTVAGAMPSLPARAAIEQTIELLES